MNTITVTLKNKSDMYALLYGGNFDSILDIRGAMGGRNLFKAHVIVVSPTGEKVFELDWYDPDYAAQPTNPCAERSLAENVQHYDGMSLTLDRSEWAAVAPETTMTWDYGYEWQTPILFAKLGLAIIRPEHKILNLDVSA